MTSKRKNILTCLIITLLIIFIYIPIRTVILEKRFVRSIVYDTQKIVIMLANFEKNKKLQDKDLNKFYTSIKDKYPIALISISDKKNRLLKSGKNENYIKSNKTFDSIIDNFLRDEFKVKNKNDFIVRYYDESRYFIFDKNIPEGKILLVYGYRIGTRLFIQLILEIVLIAIFSIIITAFAFIIKNKKRKVFKDNCKFVKPDIAGSDIEFKNTEPNVVKKLDDIKIKYDIDSLGDHVYDLFSYISNEYKPDSISLYVKKDSSSGFCKIYELKGKAFLKIRDDEFSPLNLNNEIIEELRNSSILILEKSRKITFPVLDGNIVRAIINVIREKEFKGPDITDMNARIKKLAKPLSESVQITK